MTTQSEHITPIVPASSDIPTVENQNFEETIDHVLAEAPLSRPESPENSENFEPEIEEENSGAFYHRGPKAFPQSQISENGKAEQLLQYLFHYFGGDYLGIPTRNDIVAENDEGLSAILNNALAKREEIPFMAVDFEGSSEKIGEKNHYVLRLYGSLINGQKAVVTLTGIQIFFDILVPDKEFIDDFKIKIDVILSSVINTYKIEYIKAFPLRGYHTEKKSYLRIFTLGSGDRKKALQAIQDNNFETASDDMFSFHRKIARENGIAISGWSMISKYRYKKHSHYTHDFQVSINDFRPVEDLKMISDRFPISALMRDRTLILTWDIETQSRELGEFAEIHDEENIVFMICMTLHWKDDPRPLKQICLVDLETAPDP